MADASAFPLRFFDPQDEVQIIERKLPHWSQRGTLCFITFRTWDSMPKSVVEKWFAERREWLRQHGIEPTKPNWKARLTAIGSQTKEEFRRVFSERWQTRLDACFGACVLRQPELSSIVANSLKRFDGERYMLTDFTVMPNHVHILAAFADERAMLAQCDSWRHYTARQINERLGRKGRFWQQDGFDHLVRTEEQFEYLRRYIRDNPERARLKKGEYAHYSKQIQV
jgi:putative transposase